MAMYRFQTVTVRAQKAGWCSVCGKRVNRSRLFEQTVNQFNRNADGSPKTYDEVRADVNREAAEWVPDFTHAKCQGMKP